MAFGNQIYKMTVNERQKAGIGAVGPNHPKAREWVKKMGSKPIAPKMEEDPMPEESDDSEDGAPNFALAACCGNCGHYDGEGCGKHDMECQPTDRCDDFEEGAGEDSEQGAEMTGEY